MSARQRPSVWSIPASRHFADALVEGLIVRHGRDPLTLSQGLIVLPNHRAARAVRDAFVRVAEPALLLPRMVTVGDAELAEAAGLAFDPAGLEPIPPAIDPLRRRLMLARMISDSPMFGMEKIDAALAFRLAGDLGHLLDQLTIEKKTPDDLAVFQEAKEQAEHWQASAALLDMVRRRYPAELAALGLIDLTDRRNRLIEAAARRWEAVPPPGFVVAAGISTAAPAIAGLLRVIARLERGDVVMSALDLSLPDDQWQAICGVEDQPGAETHPQHHLSILLSRMGVSLREVRPWPGGDGPTAKRVALVAKAMAPSAFTGDWHKRGGKPEAMPNVSITRFAQPADEAQGIAIALREALEVPGQRAALVTPDRALAARVAAHLRRWGIEADDSAGKPLSLSLAGGLMQALARVAADRFGPAALLALIKHPLVKQGEERRGWLDGARWLDAALRGPRPAPGLAAILAHLEAMRGRDRKAHARAIDWWREQAPQFEAFDAAMAANTLRPAAALAALREAATLLGGETVWSGQEGRAVADLLSRFEALAEAGPQDLPRDALPHLLRVLLDTESVRPAWGGHHRLFIWGLLEARLQSADLVILGGLNEGSWPQLPSPDAFLAPRLRRELGLPGMDFRIGLSAHDFTLAMGAPRVILTRAERDASAPTLESRFLLRLTALATASEDGLPLARLALAIDAHPDPRRAARPAPAPPADERPRKISISQADKLRQDPYGFYAQTMLGLDRLRPVEGPEDAAWRGTVIHAVLEAWGKVDGYAAGRLIPRLEAALSRPEVDPALRAFGLPRLREAMGWIDAAVQAMRRDGREPIFSEAFGEADLNGIRLRGKPDRIDRLPDGTLAIVDYKSGSNPTPKQVQEGFALQLGLLGVLAECGAFDGVKGEVSTFEYWRLIQSGGKFGKAHAMSTGKEDHRTLAEMAHEVLEKTVNAYLWGDAPFCARLHPEFANYADYDQLMRLEEWYGPQG